MLVGELVGLYGDVRALARRYEERGGAVPGRIVYGLPNALGLLRRIPGTVYHRPGPNGREDPPTDLEIRAALHELRAWKRQIEDRAEQEEVSLAL